MNLRNKLFLALIFLFSIILTACDDKYENHALAIRNNTSQIITFERYLGADTYHNIEIAPNAYIKFFETSTELWLNAPVELEKVSDSLTVEYEDLTITFAPDFVEHYSENPYHISSTWITEIDEYSVPAFIGKKEDRTYIHIIEINEQNIEY